MSDYLINALEEIWKGPVALRYREGNVTNKFALIAETYFQLREAIHPWGELWVSPWLNFPEEKGAAIDELEAFVARQRLRRKRPDLLISEGDRVIAMVEFDFSPSAYLDYRNSLRKMLYFAQMTGKSELFLQMEADKGVVDQRRAFWLDEQMLFVYAVIVKKGSMALDLAALQDESIPFAFPANFLHLSGSVQQNRIIFKSKGS